MSQLVESRFVISLALSAVAGIAGLHTWPFPADNSLLALIEVSRPTLFAGFSYAYATVWFSTPFFVLNILFSLAYIFVARTDRPARLWPLPPYPPSTKRDELFLVLGEQHHRTSPTRAADPRWLVIPQRRLY